MAKDGSSNNKRAREVDDAEVVVVGDENPPSTLPEIQERIKQLIKRIPSKEETAALTIDDIPAMERWCKTVRKITRDYNLSLNFVAIANYQWEPDRPGHTGQSLGALRNQIQLSTAQTNIVSNHIARVLTPSLDTRLHKKTIVEKPNGDKEETYEYMAVINDPEMLQLNREQLCEEAIYKRQLVLSTMNQMVLCMDDYQKAEAGAAGAETSRFSMAY
ncbi:hypothetical protein ACHAXM_006573 [Skeletonema potamos]